ncbi:MAG TPA: glycosyltransferase [Blastocatellia bacterium]|jgi:glycosyltransferase involved in cell wall biosynthesis
MHIVMLSDAETEGGAAVAASRLAQGLVEAGQKITRLVAYPDGKEHTWDTSSLASPDPPALGRRIIRRLLPESRRGAWDRSAVHNGLAARLDSLSPDVINVHNLHKAAGDNWSAELARICGDHAPTVWTLHDMWSFTGRCAYNYDCEKFLSGCDSTCPTPEEHPPLAPERIAQAWNERRRVLSSSANLMAVAPSRWLARQAREGLWAGRRIEVIPYGLPLDVYRPVERALAREALGINTPGPVLLMAAQFLTERRKGGEILERSLMRLSRRPITIVTLGVGHLSFRADGIHVHELGYVDHERTKVLAYGSADLFVHPAPVDNLPNVVMESLACGTPVVGFAIGGMPDMVRPGTTGWLCDSVTPEALAITLQQALSDIDQGVDLRDSCRAVAEAEYDSSLQARHYLALFRSLAGRNQAA